MPSVKLQSAKLVVAAKQGKERMIEITKEGLAFCDAYKEVRERLLVGGVNAGGLSEEQISALAAQLRILSGSYNQATMAAATL